LTHRSSNWSWVAIFIHRYVNYLGFRNFDSPSRFFASLGFDDHLDSHGGFSFTKHVSIEADDVPDIDRGYKTNFSHRSGNEIPRRLPRSRNGASQVDMTQDYAAEDGPVRIGIAREHGHPQRWIAKFSHQLVI
jgi:hypothetical protein